MNTPPTRDQFGNSRHLHVRVERPEDEVSVRDVLVAAFARPAEADLVETLRERDAIFGSWIAEISGEIIGYIAFSPLRLEPAHAEIPLVALAPVAVHPNHQRKGYGTLLTKAALRHLRGLGVAAVMVLGPPSFYHRFGFVPAAQFGITCTFPPASAFMALELSSGALAGCEDSTARFHRSFDVLPATE